MDDRHDMESRKELRFVTSAEQMLPFLDRIRESIYSDDENGESVSDQNASDDTNESSDPMEESNYRKKQKNGPISMITIPPAIAALATTASIALPNIYEEYVNFIDLSVLNPIVDAADCQRDTLIENEISERFIPFFIFIYNFVLF